MLVSITNHGRSKPPSTAYETGAARRIIADRIKCAALCGFGLSSVLGLRRSLGRTRSIFAIGDGLCRSLGRTRSSSLGRSRSSSLYRSRSCSRHISRCTISVVITENRSACETGTAWCIGTNCIDLTTIRRIIVLTGRCRIIIVCSSRFGRIVIPETLRTPVSWPCFKRTRSVRKYKFKRRTRPHVDLQKDG